MAHHHTCQKHPEETRKLTDATPEQKQKMGEEDTRNKISFNFNITVSGMWQSSSIPVSSTASSETFI
jgi:hypothetical protein